MPKTLRITDKNGTREIRILCIRGYAQIKTPSGWKSATILRKPGFFWKGEAYLKAQDKIVSFKKMRAFEKHKR